MDNKILHNIYIYIYIYIYITSVVVGHIRVYDV